MGIILCDQCGAKVPEKDAYTFKIPSYDVQEGLTIDLEITRCKKHLKEEFNEEFHQEVQILRKNVELLDAPCGNLSAVLRMLHTSIDSLESPSN